jgi:DNA polymerase III epsilon subunit-like protein
MYLVFDTETTGLPTNWKAHVTDLKNWPRVIQLAWQFHEDSGNLIAAHHFLIQPDGFLIPPASAAIHQITTERAMEQGLPLREVLQKFSEFLNQGPRLIAHNYSFDSMVMGAEYLRLGQPNPFPQLKHTCTMQETIDFVGIPGKYGNKWPTLQELHTKLFGKGFEDGHDARVDVAITAKCYAAWRDRMRKKS